MWDKISRDEKIKLIREGVKAGKTASQIATWIGGCSRNAVIGIAVRAGIQLNRNKYRFQKEQMKEVGRRQCAKNNAKRKRMPKVQRSANDNATAIQALAMVRSVRPAPTAPIVEPVMRNLPLIDIRDTLCKWPNQFHPGEPGFGFCGKSKEFFGSPYCQFHSRLAWAPPEQRRRRAA